ncbi:unnamed protein product [Linum tenue]|uniref:Uncharacterized protein n=1 Tax=Linum tenue TaxID=586396 RepID=A0AAV0MFA4_9ROSI|nr:unnamed protein product [Linum tenue]
MVKAWLAIWAWRKLYRHLRNKHGLGLVDLLRNSFDGAERSLIPLLQEYPFILPALLALWAWQALGLSSFFCMFVFVFLLRS